MRDFVGEATQILEQLRQSRQTLAVAESVTGGLLAGAITDIAGSSDVFIGGVVAYHSRIKSELLDVDPQVLTSHGVVSREVAMAMAQGVQRLMGSDWAIATTGVAGPGPSQGVAAGQVWIAISGPGQKVGARTAYAELLELSGNRQEVRLATIARALREFSRILRG